MGDCLDGPSGFILLPSFGNVPGSGSAARRTSDQLSEASGMPRGRPPSSRPLNLTRRGVLACAVASSFPPLRLSQSGLAQVMGAPVAYEMRGGRSPTVIFESGLGDGLETWRPVLAGLDPSIGYVAYDRPGYGRSGELPIQARARDSLLAVELLRALLGVLEPPRPYLLVGHSLGGLYIAKYAATYPSDVAGMIFVDGRPPRFRARCDAEDVPFCRSRSAPPPPGNWPAHMVQEIAGLRASEDAAPDAEALASFPATVITATRAWAGEEGAAGFALWLRAQQEFAAGFRDHRFIRAEESGHYVQRDRPDLVIREVEAMHGRVSERQ